MSDIISIGIIFLAALTHAFLQLGLGSLLLLYHASLGKHVQEKTKTLVSSFISGFGMIILLAVAASCFIIYSVFDGHSLPVELLSALIGIIFAVAIIMWAFYYRRGKTTELWIPKTIARFISSRARVTNSNTEAFSLGLLACFAEFPLSFALVVIAANSILELNIVERNIALVGYILITILPLVIARFCIRRGKTVVDIQRWREKNKTFLRIISGILFLVLGTFLIAYRLIGIPL